MKLKFLFGVCAFAVIYCDAAKIRQKFKISPDIGNSVQFKEALRIPSHEISPYLAAIHIKNLLWCSGVIVDPRWVLTAAHCLNYIFTVGKVAELISKTVEVSVLTDDLQQFQEIVVTDVVRHPAFEVLSPPHGDVAMLRLKRPVTTSYTVSRSIELFEGFREPFYQSFVAVTGFRAQNNKTEAWLNRAQDDIARLEVRTHQYCIDSYRDNRTFLVTKEFFCGSYRNGKDTCMFNAGAPAVQNDKLMGIMLFGPEKCDSNQPTVFIKTFFFKGFVTSTIVNYRDPKTTVATTDISTIKEPTASEEPEKETDEFESEIISSVEATDEVTTLKTTETLDDVISIEPANTPVKETTPDEALAIKAAKNPLKSITTKEEKSTAEETTKEDKPAEVATTSDEATDIETTLTLEEATTADDVTTIEAAKTSDGANTMETAKTPDDATTMEAMKTPDEETTFEAEKKSDEVTAESVKTTIKGTTIDAEKPEDPTNLEETKVTDKVTSTIGATITDDTTTEASTVGK